MEKFVEYLKKNVQSAERVFRLAQETSLVLLNGGGFDGPEWSVRASLANLNERIMLQSARESSGYWMSTQKNGGKSEVENWEFSIKQDSEAGQSVIVCAQGECTTVTAQHFPDKHQANPCPLAWWRRRD